MEVPPERKNASPEGPIVSSDELCRIFPEGLRYPGISKLSLKGVSVSSGGIRLNYHA